jgi:transcription termination factor Rho
MYDIIELNGKSLPELQEIAKGLNVPKYEKLMKQDLVYQILDQQALIPAKDEKPVFIPDLNKSKRGRKKKIISEESKQVSEVKPKEEPRMNPRLITSQAANIPNTGCKQMEQIII